MSITRPIAEHARRLPDEPALIVEGRKTTRRDLDHAVARLASLIANKTSRDGAVALDLPNGAALAVLFLAAASAGRNAQILDHEWPAATTRKVISALKPGLVITAREELEDKALVIDGTIAADKVADALGAPAEFRRLSDPDSETIFYTGFTSGSTGLPKGFRRTHKSWLASFAGTQQEFEIGPTDCVFALGPLSHSMPLYALASAMHAGAKFVMSRGFQAHSALRTVSAQRATIIYAVPAQLLLMIEAAEADRAVCHSVRLVLCSGSKWPGRLTPRLKKVFPKALFAEFYGASELSFVTLARSDERAPKKSVGRAFLGVSVSVRDAKGKNCPPGRAGLIFAESPLVFAGYADGDGDVVRAGNALSVGDRGFLDKNGFLHLEGRSDRLVIASGRNIQPEEVETVLGLHSSIASAAVFGAADKKRSARLVALVRLKPDVQPRSADLFRHLKKILPAYKIPRRIGTVKKWPETRSGKTDFAKLQKMWEQGKYEALE
jgi:long-chain acyl-CoA synthetase